MCKMLMRCALAVDPLAPSYSPPSCARFSPLPVPVLHDDIVIPFACPPACLWPYPLTSPASVRYNIVRVWSSTPCHTCGAAGYITHAGSVGAVLDHPKACTPVADGAAFVRCCADRDADCSSAGLGDGRCQPLGRKACTTVTNTCGPCLAGLTLPGGDATLPGNTQCLDTQPPVLSHCPLDRNVTANAATGD